MLNTDTTARMQRLLRHREAIDRFYRSGEPIGRPIGFGASYEEAFDRFRDQLVADGWLDGTEYSQKEGFDYMRRPSRLAVADLDTLKRLLLFCDRGEYWGSGFWADAIARGFVSRLLHRMQVLLDEGTSAA